MPNVIITGGGRRLGKAIALEFALRRWNIAIIYFQSEDSAADCIVKARALGVNAEMYKADARSYEDLEIAFCKIKNDFDSVNVLVNNAGVYPHKANLEETGNDLWENTVNTNLRSCFYTSKLFKKISARGGRIINIASLGAFQIWEGRIPYNVSKAGVIQLTKALARDLAPALSVNSISPGTIIIPGEPSATEPGIPAEKVPMKRHGNPMDIFDAVWFFATCSSYITGQNISVDGGRGLVN